MRLNTSKFNFQELYKTSNKINDLENKTSQQRTISGFSKLSKRGKIKWIVQNFFKDPEVVAKELKSYWLSNEDQQKIIDGFSENTISNFYLPYGVAPNFKINDETYVIPMVTEESSVVAAVSKAAKFWMSRGGFKAEILGTKKVGQLHFSWNGAVHKLQEVLTELTIELKKDAQAITANMDKRGGGIQEIELVDFTDTEPNYYQLRCNFETCDSMGANFINSCLESFGQTLIQFITTHPIFSATEKEVVIIMAILSNYTPECVVRASVECPIADLGQFGEMDAEMFRFQIL